MSSGAFSAMPSDQRWAMLNWLTTVSDLPKCQCNVCKVLLFLAVYLVYYDQRQLLVRYHH